METLKNVSKMYHSWLIASKNELEIGPFLHWFSSSPFWDWNQGSGYDLNLFHYFFWGSCEAKLFQEKGGSERSRGKCCNRDTSCTPQEGLSEPKIMVATSSTSCDLPDWNIDNIIHTQKMDTQQLHFAVLTITIGPLVQKLEGGHKNLTFMGHP